MVVKSGAPVRSVNAGEFDPGALSRIDTKQYYSGAKRMKNFEPVPQSGFRLMGGTRRMMAARRPLAVLAITGPVFSAGPHAALVTLWSGTVAGSVSAVHLPGLSASAGTTQIVVEALVSGVWTAIAPAAFVIGQVARDVTAAFPPQSGKAATSLRVRATPSVAATFTLGTVTAWSESGTPPVARHGNLSPDDGKKLSVMVSAGIADFADADGYCGSALLPLTSADMLVDIDIYGEADTIGIAHPSTVPTQRIRRYNGSKHDWSVDAWPYDPVPEVILDGTYVKTDDVWDVMVNWEGDINIFISVTVDGEQTPAVALKNGGVPITTNPSTDADWDALAAEVQTELQALPSLGVGVTCTHTNVAGLGARKLTITFGGDLSGDEYQTSADIVNTVKASANMVHIAIGETEGEGLWSVPRGYPGLFELVQDRMAHGRIPAKTGALALSRAGEYFDFNIEGQNDAAARLDNLRSQTTETIYAIKASKYIVLGTDRGMYFAVNRTIERNTPLNFVQASETGIRVNSRIVDLEGILYYVSNNGEQLLSLIYDDVSTSYNADAQSLLASHLISGVLRPVRQIAQADQDASKLWLPRDDGRLICGQLIRNQDITGFCEWRAAAAGLVREIGVDGANRLWLLIQRNSVWQWELYENEFLLHGTEIATCDLGGTISNLKHLTGDVWAVAGDAVYGPFTVNAGSIALGDFVEGDIHVGYWIAPEFETMPQPFVTRDEQIVFRPGRIHSAHVNVIDTTSIAIGANGGAVRNVPLNDMGDAVNLPMPPKTRMISKIGMLGSQVGPTAVISQVKPGRLRVRDLALEAKL